MQGEWYCRIAGKVCGPMTASELMQLAQKGTLTPNDEVRKDAGNWRLAGEIKNLCFAVEQPKSSLPAPPAGKDRTRPDLAPGPAFSEDDAKAQELWQSVIETAPRPAPQKAQLPLAISPMVLWMIGGAGVGVTMLTVVIAVLLLGRSNPPVRPANLDTRQQARAEDEPTPREREKPTVPESVQPEREKQGRADAEKVNRDNQARADAEADARAEKERLLREQKQVEDKRLEEQRLEEQKRLHEREEKLAKAALAALDNKQYLQVKFSDDNRFGITLVGTRDGKRLTYSDDGGTNNTCLMIEGRAVNFTGAHRRPEEYKDGAIVGWKSTESSASLKVTVIQDVSIRRGEQSRKLDTCLIRYTLKNEGTKSRQLGIRVMIDTLIGSNDGVPFTVPGKQGLCGTFYVCQKGKDMPDFIQVLENPDLRQPGTVAQMGIRLSGEEGKTEPPDVLALTAWPSHNPPWTVPVTSITSKNDSAVVLYWMSKPLAAGTSREVAFTYGLGGVESNESGDLALTVGGSFRKNGEFTVTAYVKVGLKGGTVTLNLPEGLQLVDATKEPLRQEVLGSMKEPITQVSWRVKGVTAGKHKITATMNQATQTKEVNITDGMDFGIVEKQPQQR